MRKKMQPYQDGSHNRSQHLSCDVRTKLRVITRRNSEPERNGRVEKGVFASAGDCSEHASHYSEGPSGGNAHQAGGLPFATFQKLAADDAVAHQIENQR